MNNFARITVTLVLMMVGTIIRFAVYHFLGASHAADDPASGYHPASYPSASSLRVLESGQATPAAAHSPFSFGSDTSTDSPTAPGIPTPNSSWIQFSTIDPNSDEPIRHARLVADSLFIGNHAAASPSRTVLEMIDTGVIEGRAILTITPLPRAQCTAVHTLHAKFDFKPAETLAVHATPSGAGCELVFTNFQQVFADIRNGVTLIVTTPAAAGPVNTVTLNVNGLTWDPS